MHNINSISNVDVNCKFHVNYKSHTISFRCRGLSGLKLWGGGGKQDIKEINGPPWRPKGVGVGGGCAPSGAKRES